jgi:hypothetical protein
MAMNGVSLKTNGVWKCAIILGGTGYDDLFNVSFTGGGGSGASGYAIASGGVVTSIVMTKCGKGYTSAPIVDLSAGGGLLATATSTLGTGFLLRYGYCDFTTSGGWDGTNEEQHECVGGDLFCFNDPFYPASQNITQWNGSTWTEILRT